MVYYQPRPSDRPYGMTLISGRARLEKGRMSQNTAQYSSQDFQDAGHACGLEPRQPHSVFVFDYRLLSQYLYSRALSSAGYEFLMQHCSYFEGLARHVTPYLCPFHSLF